MLRYNLQGGFPKIVKTFYFYNLNFITLKTSRINDKLQRHFKHARNLKTIFKMVHELTTCWRANIAPYTEQMLSGQQPTSSQIDARVVWANFASCLVYSASRRRQMQ